MAKRDDSKIRLIAIYRMIESGEKLTSTQIINMLERQFDIKASRKTIYSDLMAIDRFIPLQSGLGRSGGSKKYDAFVGGAENGA